MTLKQEDSQTMKKAETTIALKTTPPTLIGKRTRRDRINVKAKKTIKRSSNSKINSQMNISNTNHTLVQVVSSNNLVTKNTDRTNLNNSNTNRKIGTIVSNFNESK